MRSNRPDSFKRPSLAAAVTIGLMLLGSGLAAGQSPEEAENQRYTEFPGIDTSVMSDEELAAFIDRANTDRCTCGCPDPSVAWCLYNHDGCDFPMKILTAIAADVSENFEKTLSDEVLANLPTYLDPPETMMHEFDYLKGFDLDPLSDTQRTILLRKANALPCECGCKGDTLARCVNTDPHCVVAPEEIKKLIEEVKVTAIQ